jgi:trans-2-enoyl-CoA reductase
VSYHNLGVEQEFLKMYQESLESYKQAKTFAKLYLGEKDSIYINLNDVYNKAKAELDKHMERRKEKQARQQAQDPAKRAVSAARTNRPQQIGPSMSNTSINFMAHSR